MFVFHGMFVGDASVGCNHLLSGCYLSEVDHLCAANLLQEAE